MGMVTVTVARDFAYRGTVVYAGDAVEMEAIDASIAAKRGDVNLLARPTYLTRDMVPTPVVAAVVVAAPDEPTPKRRGRPRKKRADQ